MDYESVFVKRTNVRLLMVNTLKLDQHSIDL